MRINMYKNDSLPRGKQYFIRQDGCAFISEPELIVVLDSDYDVLDRGYIGTFRNININKARYVITFRCNSRFESSIYKIESKDYINRIVDIRYISENDLDIDFSTIRLESFKYHDLKSNQICRAII